MKANIGTWCTVRVDGVDLGPMSIEDAARQINRTLLGRRVDAIVMAFWDDEKSGSSQSHPITKKQMSQVSVTKT